jgi:hypothetical protein
VPATQPSPGVPDPGTRPPKIETGTGPGNALLAGVNALGGPGAVANLNPFSGLDATVSAARAWVSDRHNWTRIMWFGGGVVCFAVGVAMLAGRPAGQAITTVVPAGKAVKALGAVK